MNKSYKNNKNNTYNMQKQDIILDIWQKQDNTIQKMRKQAKNEYNHKTIKNSVKGVVKNELE